MAIAAILNTVGGHAKSIDITSTALHIPAEALPVNSASPQIMRVPQRIHAIVVVPPEIANDPGLRVLLAMMMSSDGGASWRKVSGSTTAGAGPEDGTLVSGHEEGYEPGGIEPDLNRNFVFIQEDSGGTQFGPSLGGGRLISNGVMVHVKVNVTGGNGDSLNCPVNVVLLAKDATGEDLLWDPLTREQVLA